MVVIPVPTTYPVLPEEIVHTIFSYLPTKVLVDLKLSNREYWEIYRLRVKKVPWNRNVIWIDKMLKTTEMILTDNGLYVQSLYSLELGDPKYTYTQKIPVQSGLVEFDWLEEVMGYVWHPPNVPVNYADVQQVLNFEEDTTAPPFGVDASCSGKIVKIFNKYIFEDATSCIDDEPNWVREQWADYIWDYDDDTIYDAIRCNIGRDPKWISPRNERKHEKKNFKKIPGAFKMPLVLYLKEDYLDVKDINGKPELVDYDIDFADADGDSDGYKIWKVLKNKQDIGRAVLSTALNCMVDRKIPGVALFVNERNLVYGFGNFSIYRESQNAINKSNVFKKHNFAIVKENIYNRTPIDHWLIEMKKAGKIVKVAVKDSRKKTAPKHRKTEPVIMLKAIV